MKIYNISSSNLQNTNYKPQTTVLSNKVVINNSVSKDILFLGRTQEEYVRHRINNWDKGTIENRNIKTLDVVKPNFFHRNFRIILDYLNLEGCEIGELRGDGVYLRINKGSKVGSASNLRSANVYQNCSVDNLTNLNDAAFWGTARPNPVAKPPKGGYVYANSVFAKDKSRIDEIKAKYVNLATGANVNLINANKLVIEKSNNDFGADIFKDVPVFVDRAKVLKEDIPPSIIIKLDDDEKSSELYKKTLFNENGMANVEFCTINNLECEELIAKEAELKKVKAGKCSSITDSSIDVLYSSNIKDIKNSKINKIICEEKKLYLDKDRASQVGIIEFSSPEGGTIIIKNEGDKIIDYDIPMINGTKEYNLTNYKSDSMTVSKTLTAGNGVSIGILRVKEPNAKITLIGDAQIDRIVFEKGGQVILKKNSDGVAPDLDKINIINGMVKKDYKLKGLDRVVGMDDLKQELREAVIDPLKEPELYKSYGLDVLNGFLMYGPPGCGKTFIAQQLVEETGRYLVEINPNNVGSIYQNQTAQNIASKFAEAVRNAPSIVFIDEVESIAPNRDQLSGENPDYNANVTQLLQELNNSKDKGVFVILASNEPQKIDKAIKRTGRTDKKIYVGPPDLKTRMSLFESIFAKNKHIDSTISVEKLSQLTENYTAKDIEMVIRTASLRALKQRSAVTEELLIEAIEKVPPSLTYQDIEDYKAKGEQ